MERAVRAAVGNADVVVHVEPVRAGEEGFTTLVRMAAARHGLGAHAIQVYRTGARASLDVHLEVPAALTVGEADALVCRFEEQVRAGAPELGTVHVHTEPVADAADHSRGEEAGEDLRSRVGEVLGSLPGAPEAEELRVVRADGGLRISFRWTLAPDLPATAARERALEAERRLRELVPGVARVLVRFRARP